MSVSDSKRTPILSLIIPAYNEAQRLPPYLSDIREHLSQQYGEAYEVIVVDDGGDDGLMELLSEWKEDWPQLRFLRHPENRGKGAAVRTGVLASTGEILLYADADGATPIAEQDRLRTAIASGADLAVASRLVSGHGVQRNRGWPRSVIGRAFAAVAPRLLRVPVRDTQCGFKMMDGPNGRELFRAMDHEGFLFDLELLMLARQRGCRIEEVPVNWSDRCGSRLHIMRHSGRILYDLWRLWRRRSNLDHVSPEAKSPGEESSLQQEPPG